MAYSADVLNGVSIESQPDEDSDRRKSTDEAAGFISPKEFEKELPLVEDGQVSLSELLSRVVQSVYAEMTEMAETYAFY